MAAQYHEEMNIFYFLLVVLSPCVRYEKPFLLVNTKLYLC